MLEGLQSTKEVKINAISQKDFSAVKSSYIAHRESVRPRKSVKPLAECTEKPTKEALIDAILNSSADTPEQKAQLLELIFNDTSFNQTLPKSIQAAAKTAQTQKMFQNTCHFNTFLELFSANETAKGRAQAAFDIVVLDDDAQKVEKEQAKVLLQAILENNLSTYTIAFHQFKVNIQNADVLEGQESSPSSSIELANKAYQLLMGGDDANLFGELKKISPDGSESSTNANVMLDLPKSKVNLRQLIVDSKGIKRYELVEGSNHILLSIPRVYITEGGLRQKNTSIIKMEWKQIEIDGNVYKPVAIGVHYGPSPNGGHHECYKPGTRITDAMKKGLDYVVLQKVAS